MNAVWVSCFLAQNLNPSVLSLSQNPSLCCSGALHMSHLIVYPSYKLSSQISLYMFYFFNIHSDPTVQKTMTLCCCFSVRVGHRETVWASLLVYSLSDHSEWRWVGTVVCSQGHNPNLPHEWQEPDDLNCHSCLPGSVFEGSWRLELGARNWTRHYEAVTNASWFTLKIILDKHLMALEWILETSSIPPFLLNPSWSHSALT